MKKNKKNTHNSWSNYWSSSQQEDDEIQERREQLGNLRMQDTLLVSAYDKQTAHKHFRSSLEWFEKYVEVVCPDYRISKKINDKNIKRQDANDPNKVKRLLSSSLFGFQSLMEVIKGDEKSKQSLYDEIKKEYYEWIGATGIGSNNCPLELKHFLFEFNEVLEGRGDKLERDIENRKWDIDPNSVEYEEAFGKLFTNIGNPLDNERSNYENLKGKTQKDINFSNNFGGNSEQAEQAFKQMSGEYDYQGFNFIPQKDSQYDLQTRIPDRFQQRTNSVIIRNVEQNPKDWIIDEVVIGYDEFDKSTKWEKALIHKSAEIGPSGEIYGSQPVYLAQRFSSQEITEIKKVLDIYNRQQRIKNYSNLSREQLSELVVDLEDRNRYLEAEIQRLKAEPNQTPEIQQEIQNMETRLHESRAVLNSIVIPNKKPNTGNFPIISIFSVVGVISLLGLIAYKVKKNKIKK